MVCHLTARYSVQLCADVDVTLHVAWEVSWNPLTPMPMKPGCSKTSARRKRLVRTVMMYPPVNARTRIDLKIRGHLHVKARVKSRNFLGVLFKPTTPSHDNIQNHHSARSTAHSLLLTHCCRKRETTSMLNLNWCAELEDTVWRIQIPCCMKGIGTTGSEKALFRFGYLAQALPTLPYPHTNARALSLDASTGSTPLFWRPTCPVRQKSSRKRTSTRRGSAEHVLQHVSGVSAATVKAACRHVHTQLPCREDPAEHVLNFTSIALCRKSKASSCALTKAINPRFVGTSKHTLLCSPKTKQENPGPVKLIHGANLEVKNSSTCKACWHKSTGERQWTLAAVARTKSRNKHIGTRLGLSKRAFNLDTHSTWLVKENNISKDGRRRTGLKLSSSCRKEDAESISL